MTTRQIIHRRKTLARIFYGTGMTAIFGILLLGLLHKCTGRAAGIAEQVGVLSYAQFVLLGGLLLSSIGKWIFEGTAHCVHCDEIIPGTMDGRMWETSRKTQLNCPKCGKDIDLEGPPASQDPR